MPEWLNEAVFYEIYPQSFYDSNGDGIGDFKGIQAKLDYIKELGCNAIWMNPCYDSPFVDAGYDVRSYRKVASRYGTMNDIEELFEAAHSRGMHIILDLVPGHTSDQHPWFIESSKPERNNYSDRYIWTDDWYKSADGLKCVAGVAERCGCYVTNFFHCQPALNYGFLNPTESWQLPMDAPGPRANVEALKNNMRFWLNAGCDGFRVDMAYSLVKYDDDKRTGTSAIWSEVRKMLDDEYPEAALVSEWNSPEQAIPAGFHMDFFLNEEGNGYNILIRDNNPWNAFFNSESNRCILDFMDEYLPKYEAIKKIGKYCLITGNHDTIRASRFLNNTELKLAYAFILTMPGAPFIYYGDEIGMRYLDIPTKEGGYSRTGSRTPMQWDDSENLGFSKASKDQLYLPVDGSSHAPTVKNQKEKPDSLYNTVKNLLSIRNNNANFSDDLNFEFLYGKRAYRTFAYKRGKVVIVCNPSGKSETIGLADLIDKSGELNMYGLSNMKTLYEIGHGTLSRDVCKMDAQSFVIFEMM